MIFGAQLNLYECLHVNLRKLIFFTLLIRYVKRSLNVIKWLQIKTEMNFLIDLTVELKESFLETLLCKIFKRHLFLSLRPHVT